MLDTLLYVAAVLVTVTIPAVYVRRMRTTRKRSADRWSDAVQAGLVEPPSLHPVIDDIRCIGCAACLDACPEGEILGLVDGRAQLVAPTKCIGHGACQAACPMDAVELVFGTATRGVDIPLVQQTFETNVPGVYIAGELGGMGLIRNAVTQGRQAVEHIGRSLNGDSSDALDLVIVGAGPAGLAATLQAVKQGLRFITVEQEEDVGGAVLSYPRQKLVMTQPMEIPLYGAYDRREVSKEELLELWHRILRDTQVTIEFGQRVESIQRFDSQLSVRTTSGQFIARRVLLAIGRRGTPRKLGVPGEVSSKVAYKLLEPEQYRHKRMLVVGGGDSAVEAALALSDQDGTDVALSYRKSVFSRIKEGNRSRLDEAVRQSRIHTLLDSVVQAIEPTRVILTQQGYNIELENDFVLVFAGGHAAAALLAGMGVQVETKHGTR